MRPCSGIKKFPNTSEEGESRHTLTCVANFALACPFIRISAITAHAERSTHFPQLLLHLLMSRLVGLGHFNATSGRQTRPHRAIRRCRTQWLREKNRLILITRVSRLAACPQNRAMRSGQGGTSDEKFEALLDSECIRELLQAVAFRARSGLGPCARDCGR